jgi:hypothetical protein
MTKKIVSFGDSFIFGTELQDNNNGSKAWPGLIAKDLGYDYETLAIPGCGNEFIAMQVYHYFANNTTESTLAVINWTWSQRWDFYIVGHEKWVTLGPTCVPEKLEKSLDDVDESKRIVDFAHDYCINSLLWNKFRTLQTMANVQQYITQKNINAIQTYTDRHIFDTQHHAPDYIQELQNIVKPNMLEWDGKTFLEWSDSHGFYKTETWHPLEPAHLAAAEFWKEIYKEKL